MSLFCLLFISLLSFALPQDTTSPRYYNPFSSTYHFWSPITDLPANSKIIPLYLTADNNIDLVVGAPNSKIQWYDNIRNVGGNFTLLPITTRAAAEFTNVDFQEYGASDIAFIEKNRKQMYIAKNPFRTGLVLFSQTQKSNDDQTWDELLVFDLTNNTEIDSSLKSNRIISSMLKVNIDNNDNLDVHQDFLLSVEDASHSQNSYIVMLKRSEEEGNYHVNRSFPIPSAKALKIVSYVDLNGDNVFDIVVLIDGKLNVLLSTTTEQLVWELKVISDIAFPTNYNFKHTTWVDLQGASLKSIFLIHPQTRQLGVLVNTWDGKGYPQWQFTEIVHYSLQTKDSQQTDVNDCVVLFPEYNRRIADFLCITNTDLQYYIQDDTKTNVTVNSNPPLTIEMNIFHDMPLHLLVWNETIKNDHIFYLEPGDTSAFILYSSTQGTLSWVEKNKLELDTYGWTTNFWILIMIYCLFMSMIAGIVHSLVTGRYLIYRRDGALLDKRSPNNAGPANQFHLSFGPNRRTTV